MKRILITGGLGLIGHQLSRQLGKLGHKVIIVDTKETYGVIPLNELGYLMNERSKLIPPDAVVLNTDIADNHLINLFSLYKPEIVIHLASFPRQKVVNANPQLGAKVMMQGMLNILEASVQYGVEKVVYTSSSMIYGDWKGTIKEDHPKNPIGQYAIMKLCGEYLLQDYHRKYNLNYTIYRPSAVYGPLDVEDRVISKFLLQAIRGNVLKVNGGKETLDFTYVDDLVDGLVAGVLSDRTNNQIYNITKSHSKTLLEAAKLAVKLAGNGTIEIAEKDEDYPSRGALDITKARYDFGFRPKIDIDEGFEIYYKWLKEKYI